MTTNVEPFTKAVNDAMQAMKKDPNVFFQFATHPLQVLENYGAPISSLEPEAKNELVEQLSISPSETLASINFKCDACVYGLGATLAALGGSVIIPTLIASIESKAAVNIINAIAAFTGLSFNAVVQVVQAVLAVGGSPATIYKALIKALCKKSGAC